MKQILYSIVPFGSTKQLFLTALPEENVLCSGDDTQGHGQTVRDWSKQIRSLLESCKAVLQKEGFLEDIVMSNFFLADIAMKELVRQIASEVFSSGLGVSTFVPQAPADEMALSLEIWAVTENTATKNKKSQKALFAGNSPARPCRDAGIRRHSLVFRRRHAFRQSADRSI